MLANVQKWVQPKHTSSCSCSAWALLDRDWLHWPEDKTVQPDSSMVGGRRLEQQLRNRHKYKGHPLWFIDSDHP